VSDTSIICKKPIAPDLGAEVFPRSTAGVALSRIKATRVAVQTQILPSDGANTSIESTRCAPQVPVVVEIAGQACVGCRGLLSYAPPEVSAVHGGPFPSHGGATATLLGAGFGVSDGQISRAVQLGDSTCGQVKWTSDSSVVCRFVRLRHFQALRTSASSS